MTNNNSNFNYLDTIPAETSPATSYQPVQQPFMSEQYPQQFNTQVMGPNGQMKNIPELEQSIMRFEQIKPQTEFKEIRFILPKTLGDYYGKYFAYLETIKQRRGMEEYLSVLRKILNKMNEYVSKTEQSIIKLKKTLDYTETTIPLQFQAQATTINGKSQTPNIFTIPELQNIVEKDNNIDFVDIFGLKGQNVSHISNEFRGLILVVIQSLMDFPPQIPQPKLDICLKILKEIIGNYEKDKVGNTDKLQIDNIDKSPEFKPLVKIDIYSKLFNIFSNGSLNIKDIKTDKIDEKIESMPKKSSFGPSSSSESSSYSPFGSSSYEGGADFSFGSPKRNNQQKKPHGNSKHGNSKQNISSKIKKILKYEVGSSNSSNSEFEFERLIKKKGRELTEYLFFNQDFIKELQDIKKNSNSNNNNNNENKNHTGGIPPATKSGHGHGHGKGSQGKGSQGKGLKTIRNSEKLLFTGRKIFDYIKEEKGGVKTECKKGNFSDFISKLQETYNSEIRTGLGLSNGWGGSQIIRTEEDKIKKNKRIDELEEEIKELEDKAKGGVKLDDKEQKKMKDKKTEIENIRKILKYSVLKKEIELIVSTLNNKLKSKIEEGKYEKRIMKCGQESFDKEKREVNDFFTGTTHKVSISGDTYKKQKRNDENKSIYFIQMYFMMYEAYTEYYRTYSIETIIKSFSKDTIKTDYDLKMRILNGLGVYSVIIYKKLKEVREIIKGILLQTNPDFEKAKTMLTKVQTLINSTTDEAKKEKFLKIRKNLVNEIEKFTENKKNNRGQEHQHHKNKGNFKEKKGFDKNSNPYNKPYGDKKPYNKPYGDKPYGDKPFGDKKQYGDKPYGDKKYSKKYNNNVSL